MTKTTDNQAIRALYAAFVAAKDNNKIVFPFLSRGVRGTELAKAIRGLFAAHSLKGLKITTCRSTGLVRVRFPSLAYDFEAAMQAYHTTGHDVAEGLEIRAAEQALDALIASAFPNQVDRSDSQSDLFDFRYTVDAAA